MTSESNGYCKMSNQIKYFCDCRLFNLVDLKQTNFVKLLLAKGYSKSQFDNKWSVAKGWTTNLVFHWGFKYPINDTVESRLHKQCHSIIAWLPMNAFKFISSILLHYQLTKFHFIIIKQTKLTLIQHLLINHERIRYMFR